MYIFEDESYSFRERAADLCSRLTLEEKITQIGAWTAAVPRLGIPAFHYANECSHGINLLNYFNSNLYDVTDFPVCLAMSQTWDPDKIKKVSSAISDEARAYHNTYNDSLSFWAPTINLARDPRNGRSDENFGEDPFLAGKEAAHYVQGLQGDDPKYLKAVATPKHYMMNSSENNRTDGISFADEATQREYYAKVFEYAFREGKAQSVMISYNRVNGVPSAANEFLLTTLLREEWGFDGYVTSDCGAVAMSYAPQTYIPGVKPEKAHYYYRDEAEACAGTLKAGTDLSCGAEHRRYLLDAVQRGLITEDEIDRSVIRNLTSLFRQGWFDKKEELPWASLTKEDASTEANHALSVDIANDTIVLLKNEKGVLPIDMHQESLRKILVVGPNAKYRELGGYSCGGINKMVDTPVNVMALEGIRSAVEGTGIEVSYEKGWCAQKETMAGMAALSALPGVDVGEIMAQMFGMSLEEMPGAPIGTVPEGFVPRHVLEDPDLLADNDMLYARALEAAKTADLVIMVAGTDEATASEGSDRMDLNLPTGQGEKIRRMLSVNPNTVVVLTTMGCVTDDVLDEAPTIVDATFAGEAQGTAIANVLFGKVNPNGKLTATWYKSTDVLPHINDYGMKKSDTFDHHTRTYWYTDPENVRYPFGYGLSYTNYEYGDLCLSADAVGPDDVLRVSFDVTNTGSMDGKETSELYIRKISKETLGSNKPNRQLKGFAKTAVKAGETVRVSIDVPMKEVTFWSNLNHCYEVENGEYVVEVGRSSEDLPLSASFHVAGEWNARLDNVYIDLTKYCYEIGDTGRVKVSATLENAKHLCPCGLNPSFESSDEGVAKVSSDGTITAVGSGAATIRATVVYEGISKSRELAVAVRTRPVSSEDSRGEL